LAPLKAFAVRLQSSERPRRAKSSCRRNQCFKVAMPTFNRRLQRAF
jgi:hypothetical protein